MNNLEQMKKKRNRTSVLIAIIIVLNVLLLFAFATNVGNGGGTSTVSTTSTVTPVGNVNIADVKTGANFTVALDSEGRVWSWGQNSKGQLGNGTVVDSVNKQAVLLEDIKDATTGEHYQLGEKTGSKVEQIAVGEYHAAALTEDGKVYIWGHNYFGQTGSDNIKKELYPKQITVPNSATVKQVECGADYTLILTEGGEIYGLGDSSDGQLGYYNDLAFTSIREIEELKETQELPNIKEISAGYNHVIAVGNDDTVWSWGDTTGSGFEFTSMTTVALASTPVQVQAGYGVSMALCSDGSIYTWALGSESAPTQVALADASGNPLVDANGNNVQVRTDTTKRNIGIVNKTYFIIDDNNIVYSWGQNNEGQTGTGNRNTVSTPTQLTFVQDSINKEIDKVASSAVAGTNGDTAYAINADGYVLGWGYAGTDIVDANYTVGSNNYKLLGDGTRYSADYIGSIGVKSITGDDIVLKVSESEDLIQMLINGGYITGGRVNLYGPETTSLQDSLEIKSVDENIASYDETTGNITGVTVGKTAAEIKSSKNTIYINVTVIDDTAVAFPKIEIRDNFTVALKADGTVWAWGYNNKLGITDPSHSGSKVVVPTQVQGLTNIKDIAVGENFVLALDNNGNVWAWGQNDKGQLGGGTVTTTLITYDSIRTTAISLVPVMIDQTTALTNITSISAGKDYAMAIDATGIVWAWGNNEKGQLGLNTTSSYETLAKTVDISNITTSGEAIKQIEAGQMSSYILTQEGNVYACGYSGNYQCGTTTDQLKPTKISALAKITKVSAGLYSNGYAVAATVNGNVWLWGYTGSSIYPNLVSGLSNVIDIEATDNARGVICKFADGTIGYSTNINTSSTATVTKLTNPEGTNFTDAMLINGANGAYIVAKTDGTVWTAGTTNNLNGQLGNRTTTSGSATALEDISKAYIALNEYEVTLTEGETSDVDATYKYGFNLFYDEEPRNMTYTSLDENIATVSGNTITAVKFGKTYVEAVYTDTDGLTTTLRVTVNVLSSAESAVPKVSAGYRHTVALKSDGSVWGIGYNYNGSLGATTGTLKEPEKLGISGVDVAAGRDYTLILLDINGKVQAMGYNNNGQLGNNTRNSSRTPVTVQTIDANGNFVDLDNIVKVFALDYTSFAIDKYGNLYAWGSGAYEYATKVDTYGLKVNDMTGNLILTEDGRVWEYVNSTTINFVKGLENIVEISSSAYSNSTSYGYFMALDGNGQVYTWVRNNNDKVTGSESTTPQVQTVDSSIKVVDIEAGVKVAYIRDVDGNVYSFGNNTNAFGLGASASASPTPVIITGLQNIESIAASRMSSNSRAYAVTTSGSVYGFGLNSSYSLLGNGDTTTYYEPTRVGESYAGFIANGDAVTRLYLNQGESVDVQASLLDAFNLRLTGASNGTATDFEWTVFNEDLVSITNTTGASNKLTASDVIGEAIIVAEDKISGKIARLYVDVKPTGTEVAPKVESTDNHTVALKADGTVWVWGQNNYGELGILQTGNIKEPKQARIAERIVAVAPSPKIDTATGNQATDANGKLIFESNGTEYYQSGNDYTDLAGNVAIKYDSSDSKLYEWDSDEGNYALQDLTNANGNPIIVTDIATSKFHTLMLTKDGEVYSCGNYSNNRLGYSASENQYLPKKVDGLKDIVKIAVGDNYSLALDKYGNVWAWGYSHIYANNNTCYTPIDFVTPVKLTSITGVDMTTYMLNAIDITNEYILTKDGEVISINLSLTVTDSNKNIIAGTKIEGITGKVIKITRTVTPGSTHTAFLTENGEVYTIGTGTSGQLGNDTYENSVTTKGNKYTAVQVLNKEGVALNNIRDVYTGSTHTIAIDKNGNSYTWGSNSNGELRSSQVQSGVTLARAYETEDDTQITEAILVSAGNGYSIVVDKTGFAYAWGLGTSGQLGNGLGIDSTEAVRVGIEGIRLDKNHVTLQENGSSIEVTGYNKQLNLIYNTTIDIENTTMSTDTSVATARKTDTNKVEISPVSAGTTSAVIKSLGNSGEEFRSIVQITVLPVAAEMASDVTLPEDKTIAPMTVSGDSHTLILKSDGTVFAYGDNTYGQIGAKDENGNPIKYQDKVTQVEFPAGTASIICVAAGDNFSVAVDKNGNVYTWGYNGNGQLGLGTTDSGTHNIPTRVSGLNNIVKVVAGANHCIALDKDGYVYAWGMNTSGSLGIGWAASIATPTQIDNIANVIDIAAGVDHSIALTSNGSVYTTGKNSYGQLGEQYILNRLSFAKVDIANPIEYIEAGNKTSVAIDTTGNVWVWGNNEDGQLGLGINDQKVYTPTIATVGSGEKVQSASAGSNHIQVVTSSGELYIAGSNNYGQLGVGTSVDKSNTFVKVGGSLDGNVLNSNAGTTYSTAIAKDGTVYGFGDYNHGNLDRVSLTNSFTPVMISDNTSYLDEQEVSINLGATYTLNPNGRYKLNVLHKDNSSFTYTSANDAIASVDVDGVITGNEIGTTMINVEDEIGKISSVIVKVLPADAIQTPTVEGGDKFAIVTDKEGTSYLFGNKANIIDSSIPKTINDSVSLKTVKAGDDFIVAINNDGTVWAWGDNTYSQLGVEGIANSEQIVRLNTNYIKNITQIDAGAKHVIALDELGTVYVWGDNSNGQLGINTTTTKVEIPTAIRPVEGRVISVSAGGDYSSIVDSVGKVYILRNGTANEVVGISGAVKVATGTDKTMVLTNDGNVYMVDNSTGVATLKVTSGDVVDIATNGDTFMYLTKDKKLYTFGNNANGQLGRNYGGPRHSTPNVAAENVFTIGGGANNTYYINTDGEVFAAGTNEAGELGNGTRDNANARTYKSSSTYTKVGDREYTLKEVKKDLSTKEVKSTRVGVAWDILTGAEDLIAFVSNDKTRVMLINEENEFNTFGNTVSRIEEDYTFSLTDTNKAEIDASITDYSKVTAKELGETILVITNTETNEEKELKIIIVDDMLLRIDDLFVVDSNTVKYDSEPEGNDTFIINTEGSTDTGDLKISLEFDDTVEVFDEGGNPLTVAQDSNTQEWIVSGLDLTKQVQTLTLKLTTADGLQTYEYTIIIRKDAVVEVDAEVLAPQNGDYIKFIDPNNTTANVRVTILDNTKTIQLEDKSGNILKTSVAGTAELTYDANVPDHDNEFIIKILDDAGNEVRKSKLTIYKSSIEAIYVKDIKNTPNDVLATRKDGTAPYLDEFTVRIDEANDPAQVTINLRDGHNVQSITVNNVDIASAVYDFDTPNEIELEVLDNATGNTYTEKYTLTIDKITSNNKIKQIELIKIDGNTVTLADPMFKESQDYADTWEIVLHDASIDLYANTYFNFEVTLEDAKAKVSANGRTYVDAPYEFSGVPKIENENKCYYTIYVKADNGDVATYKVVIYKESEDATIEKITTKSKLSDGTYYDQDATRETGMDTFKGKVVKNSNDYQVVIKLRDPYAQIDGTPTTTGGTLTLLSASNGEYTYSATSDIVGETITITTKAEYDNAPTETYTLTIEELGDNSEYYSIQLGNNPITFDASIVKDLTPSVANEAFSTTIKALDSDLLTVEAVSQYATIEIFDVDPSTTSTAIATNTPGTNELSYNLGLTQGQTKTVWIRITSEDGQNTNTKSLTVKRLSNDADITYVIFDGTVKKAYTGTTITGGTKGEIEVKESELTNPTATAITVTLSDTNASNVEIDGVPNDGSRVVDLTTTSKIYVDVTSEDGTVTKTHEVEIKLLSAETGIEKEIQLNGATIKQDSDFTQDTTNPNKYTVKVKNLGNVDLVITTKDSNATVEIFDVYPSTTATPIGTNTTKVDSTASTTVYVKVTAEDGTEKIYTITIEPEEPILTTVNVKGVDASNTAIDAGRGLTATEMDANYATVRVHPDAVNAAITLTANSQYLPVTVNATANRGMTDSSGNSLEKTATTTISNASGSTLYIELLDASISDTTTVVLDMTTTGGVTETLVIDIVRGSTEAELETATVTGANITSDPPAEATYINPTVYAGNVVINSSDTSFNITAKATNNGACTIYQILDNTNKTAALGDVDLNLETPITNPITLSSTPQRFVIVVTAEFGTATQRYDLYAKKISNVAELTDFGVTITGANGTSNQMTLADFGAFDSNGSIDVLVPSTVSEISLDYLTTEDSYATAKWTDIIGKDKASILDTDYEDYPSVSTRNSTISAIDLDENYGTEKHVYIKVTAENTSDYKEYCINIKKAKEDTSLTNTNLSDVANGIDFNTNRVSDSTTITEATNDAKVTSTSSDGYVSIKVISVNGNAINENIATVKPEKGQNDLELDFSKDYTYTDASGATQTILVADVEEMVVETTVASEGYTLYPAYYSNPVEAKYTLTIVRLKSDANIIVSGDINLDTKTTTATRTEYDNNNNPVYVYEFKVPSTTTEIEITNVKTYNSQATITHNTINGTNTGNDLYTSANPYTSEQFAPTDKASIEEYFEVTNPLGNTVIYRLIVTKESNNADISGITVNSYTATEDVSVTNKYDAVLAKTFNGPNIEVSGKEENAQVSMTIASVNGTPVTVTSIIATPNTNGNVEADLTLQLTDALTQAGITQADLTNITVSISVQPEDSALQPTTYTLNIDVIGMSLISVDGIDINGNVGLSYSLTNTNFGATATDKFTVVDANGKAITIAVPASTVDLTLGNIVCEAGASVRDVLDANGNSIWDSTAQTTYPFTVPTTGATQITIQTEADHISQEFVINIRKKSTDTTIKEVKVGAYNVTETNGIYEVTIPSDIDLINPCVEITLNNSNATVIDAVPALSSVTASTPANNKFTVSGIKETTHNASEDALPVPTSKTVDIEITVEAEDGNTDTYTIRLNREHVETGLVQVDYIGDTATTISSPKSTEPITISSSTQGITITSAITECANATVWVEYTDDTTGLLVKEALDATKQYDIDEGTTKDFTIIVESEYDTTNTNAGYTSRYILSVTRQSSNTNLTGINVTPGSAGSATQSASLDANIADLYNNIKIRVDEDQAKIEVLPEDSNNATVTNVNVYRKSDGLNLITGSGVVVSQPNNTFTIANLSSLYVDDATEDASNDLNRFIVVEITVAAEDTNVTKTYKLEIERVHVEAGIDSATYEYDENGTTQNGSVTFATSNPEAITVSSVVDKIHFDVTPSCNDDDVTVSMKVDGVSVTPTTTGYDVDLTEPIAGYGCIKTVDITITAECGDTKTYTIELTRMASNASLNKVYVNGKDITSTRTTSTDANIEAEFSADIKDSDTSVIIEAISANQNATVSITDANYTTTNNGKTYDEKGTYDLSSVTSRTVEILITVAPEDTAVPAKTYKLILTRLYDSTILEQIKIKPADSLGLTGEITLQDNDTHTLDFNQNCEADLTGTPIDTTWNEIVFSDILPDTDHLKEITITNGNWSVHRIKDGDDNTSTPFVIKSDTVDLEGQKLEFTITTTAESGSTGSYKIILYKKATDTNLTAIEVEGNSDAPNHTSVTPDPTTVTPDASAVTYTKDVSANSDTITIEITGKKNIDITTDITKVTSNGVDVTSQLGITKNQSTNTKDKIKFTLNNILSNLDYTNDRVLTVEISVVPEDTTIAAKTYTIEITRLYDKTILEEIKIKPAASLGLTGEITLQDNDTHTLNFTKDGSYYVADLTSIPIDTAWNEIVFSDILPDIAYMPNVKIENKQYGWSVSRTTTSDTTNTPFVIKSDTVDLEGQKLEFIITTTTEYGTTTTNPYKIILYKKATDTNLTAIAVNGNSVTPDPTTVTPDASVEDYKINVSANLDIIPIEITGKKNIDITTDITKVTSNGVDVTNQLNITKNQSTNTKDKIKFTLNNILSTLDYTNDRVLTVEISVVPEDTTIAAKTYTIEITRLYDSTILQEIKIKPAASLGITGEITLQDDDTHTKNFTKYTYSGKPYYLSQQVVIPTDWTQITLSDILPDINCMPNVKITRISISNPYTASTYGDYKDQNGNDIVRDINGDNTDTPFVITSDLEGKNLYFKVETTSEFGATNGVNPGVYVINLYKKATNTNLKEITVNGTQVTLPPATVTPDAKVNVTLDSIPIVITGNNKLDLTNTTIQVKNENGVDVTSLSGANVQIDKIRSTDQTQITFTLNNILSALNQNTSCGALDALDGKTLTVEISVVPEDTTITPSIYTITIERQHTNNNITDIVLNKGQTVDISDQYGATKTENVEQTIPSSKLSASVSAAQKESNIINVTSQLDTVEISEFNKECEHAEGTITVVETGTTYPIPLTAPISVSLLNENDTKTLKIVLQSEDKQKTQTKYVTIRRMYSDDSLSSVTVQRKYTVTSSSGVDSTHYENYPVSNSGHDYTSNIHMDADTTQLTLRASNTEVRQIEVSVDKVYDRDGNDITAGNELTNLSYVYSTSQGYLKEYTRVATINTSAGRTFEIKVKVYAEDPQIPAEEYTITLTKQDDSAEIDKAIGDGVDIPVDSEKTHYDYVGKNVLDADIYTQYIDSTTTQVVAEVIAKSKFASVYLYAEDGTQLGLPGIGTATYTIPTPDLITKMKVTIVSEDKQNTKKYEVWFIKKSNDTSISELWVDIDGNGIDDNDKVPVDPTDGNYYIQVSDTIDNLTAKMTPNYELANVSINGQPYKWQETTEIITNLGSAKLDSATGMVKIELRVQIPADQSASGVNEVNTKYLYIDMVSRDNGIEEISTDNVGDDITPGDQPQNPPQNYTTWGQANTYYILLEGTGVVRNEIDLSIVPKSPKAQVELFDLDGNTVEPSTTGTLIKYGLSVDTDNPTPYKVVVTPQQGAAKEYYIYITPKDSQAELKTLTIAGTPVDLQPGVYTYKVSNLGLTGIGEVYALAKANSIYPEDNKYGSSTVQIYTRENPSGSGVQETGEATLNNVDLDKTTFITITVESPNRANTNTYTIWLKDISDDRTLQEVSYLDEDGAKQVVTEKLSTDPNYAGEYEIVLEPEQVSLDITITATDLLSEVTVETQTQPQTINVIKDVKSMIGDIVLDIVVKAESENTSTYKLTIKKRTIITGKVITENYNEDYSGVEVNFEDPTGTLVDTTTTNADGTFIIDTLPAGINYTMKIKKDGYLPYILTDIPATYGVRRYTENSYLIAGDVNGDGNIDLTDLVKVNRLARANSKVGTTTDATNRKYDFNEDGTINSIDVAILNNNYDKRDDSPLTKDTWIRVIEISGDVLDATNNDTLIPEAKIKIQGTTTTHTTTTDTAGKFGFVNVPMETYTLTVTDKDGNVLGSEALTIQEGENYTIENNIIAINPNMSLVDITVRVNGSRAIVSKRGDQSSEDITLPTISDVKGNVTSNGIKLEATVSDANLSEITFYKEDGTIIDTQSLSGITATPSTTYNTTTSFNTTHKFKVKVTDTAGNATEVPLEVTDNVVREASDLATLSSLVNGGEKAYEDETVTLDNDLDLNDLPVGTTFTPIGSSSTRLFKGTFDGAGHTISNIDITCGNNAGLFGYTNGATIKNVGVEGTINSTGNMVAGIVGYANNTTVENCYSAMDITGKNNVAGIIGYAKGTTVITNCYNSGNITGTPTVAGIVARLTGTDVTIENCYNIGTITGLGVTGEIVGEIVGYRAATIDNTTQVISVGAVNNCYYLSTSTNSGIAQTGTNITSTIATENDKLIDTTATITDEVTLLTALGAEYKEDVDNLNNGYPVLQWQKVQKVVYSARRAVQNSISNVSAMILPVSGTYTISSEYGTRVDPLTGEAGDMHYGIDIAADYKTPILAVAGGTVTFADEFGGYGYCVEIEHEINGEKVYSFYAHLYEIDVAVGDAVSQGQTIGLEGGVPGEAGSGDSTGPHLHFEIRKTSGSYLSAVDPRTYLTF